MGLGRVEGSVNSPSFERLVVGDRTVVELDPAGALQRVWIEAEIGTLLLEGMTTVGNGCFGEYVWVHTGLQDDLRTSEPFETCPVPSWITNDAETDTVVMPSPNPDEGSWNTSMMGSALP